MPRGQVSRKTFAAKGRGLGRHDFPDERSPLRRADSRVGCPAVGPDARILLWYRRHRTPSPLMVHRRPQHAARAGVVHTESDEHGTVARCRRHAVARTARRPIVHRSVETGHLGVGRWTRSGCRFLEDAPSKACENCGIVSLVWRPFARRTCPAERVPRQLQLLLRSLFHRVAFGSRGALKDDALGRLDWRKGPAGAVPVRRWKNLDEWASASAGGNVDPLWKEALWLSACAGRAEAIAPQTCIPFIGQHRHSLRTWWCFRLDTCPQPHRALPTNRRLGTAFILSARGAAIHRAILYNLLGITGGEHDEAETDKT
ncbi:uncharacterized protein CMC5_042320 [Chondromyces crocatus]|uniref:Uncharacterized protein n=1 Tax=Chondromyces crocatus TaxID=52 RepID=A0A0K1EGW3_CHOCO|nr:uncharacterized protein CMC5_042320 [Chondromyces crocatus]